MKNSPTPIICALICLVPTLMAGQAFQKQTLHPGLFTPLKRAELNSRSLIDTPVLRLSNIGSSGQDGVSLKVENPLMTESFFDVFYDLNTGQETHMHGDPDFDLLRITSYDKATPKLSERVTSHNPSMDSFFDVFYDLSQGQETHLFGDPDFDLLRITSYNIDTPRLSERVSSHNPLMNSFFDISYDLGLGQETHMHGDPDFDLLRITSYDKLTPKLIDRVKSTKKDSFFDVFYDLNLAVTGVGFGFEPDDLCLINEFHLDPPLLHTKIQSSDTNYINSFFDIEYDLDLGTIRTEHKNFIHTMQYNESEWDFISHISSEDPSIPSFFDISYDIGQVNLQTHSTRAGVLGTAPLEMRYEYDGLSRRIREVRTDMQSNSFFDITYDLPLGQLKTECNNLITIADYDATKSEITIESKLPDIPGFFDITYDISLADVQKQWTRAGETGMPPLERRYEYDGLNRRIKHVNKDSLNGSFFDITYDLALQKIETECNHLVASGDYSDGTRHEITYKSKDPSIPSFFDITYNISLAGIQTHSIRAGAGISPPLEIRYEYDALNRHIRELAIDEQSGGTLRLERRILPGISTLAIAGHLSIENGGAISSSTGPLVLADDLMISGSNHQIIGALTVTGPAHQINGNLTINGNLQVNGGKMFKIDHPLDPDNKYLVHSCVESPDMMNVYNGNAMTDDEGYVTIKLPDYFEALNTDFRYQLTCIGQFAQAIVYKKIKDNQFLIRTDKPHVEVSWQVTGIRQDPASKRNAYLVEVDKEPEMKGKRLYQLQK